MKLILLENVPNLGQAGDVVDVKPGYGRNYLIPRQMAEIVSQNALKEIEEIKRVAVRRAERELANAKDLAGKLEGHTVKLEGKVGARGNKLYGSITTQAIATAVAAFLGTDIDKRKVSVPEQIKTLGLHNFNIRLHPEVEVEGKLEVVKKTDTSD